MRLVVCGGRVGVEGEAAAAALDKLLKIGWITRDDAVIEGDAPGYDRVGGFWARYNGLTNHKCKVDRRLDGDKDDAPKRRNQRMYDTHRPTHGLGFPGGPGTRDMLSICSKAGIPVADVEFNTSARTFHVWAWPHAGQPAYLITEGKY